MIRFVRLGSFGSLGVLDAERLFTRRLRRVLALLLVLLASGGCTPEPATILRVGTNVWPGYEPLYLARHLGYFDGAIRLVEYSSATQVINACRNGAIEAAALTLDEVLLLVQHGEDPRVVLVMDVSHGGDAILGQSELRSVSDIKGRRVGVEDTALGAYVLSRALQINGLTRADVRIVPLQVDEHERAFKEGRVDAVVTFEPARSKLLAAGARELFNSAQIPGEIMDVLVVRRDLVDRNRREIDALLRGWFRAVDYLKLHPREAAAVIARRMQMGPDQVLLSYRGLRLPDQAANRALLAGGSPQLIPALQRLTAFMVDQKLLGRPLDPTGLPDPRPLLRIAP
ncbi:MAG: ABC transporter substrate-binding protein [Nitrospirae bacterium]|nr:ABC transporter substrate-binding protein [Nitrospirota bacterium]